MDNKFGDLDKKLNCNKNFHEQSEKTKNDVTEIIRNESNQQEFNDYFNNYCQRIEYKLFRKYDSTITSFSDYINDKWSNGTGDKQMGELLEKSHCMQLFEQEIDLLFAMPRLNDSDIHLQKDQYFSIVKKYNDAHFRIE